MAGHVKEDCFGVKLSLILGIVNSTDRREEKRNFLIQGRRFRRSFKNYCNYRYFMKLSRLLSIVKLGIDVLLSEHLQSRCIDSSMYRYTPIWHILFIINVYPLRVHYKLTKQTAPSGFDSSTGGALHRYRKGHGFDFSSSPDFLRFSFVTVLTQVALINAENLKS